VHTSLTNTIWPIVAKALLEANVQLLCDAPTLNALNSISPPLPNISTHLRISNETSYFTEHLSPTLSVISLPSLSSAIQFINSHSSHHTDAIVTESEASASTFCRGVDSAGTYVNASTRFADGFRYGFGAEVGISTGKIHARGPVGLEGLVIYKYILKSETGHIVGDFGPGKREYKHTSISSTTLPI
jgi:glutamate-5-semialdehyde dehydrogenase